MLSWWQNIVCACALLLAGGISAYDEVQFSSDSVNANADSTSGIRDMTAKIGANLPISILTNLAEVTRCYLITRNGDTIELAPNDQSNDKVVSREPNLLYGCQATINDIQEEDAGIWELAYETATTKDSNRINIIIDAEETDSDTSGNGNNTDGNDNDGNEGEVFQETEVRTTTLTQINFSARLGVEITISLSKREYDETCYIQTPQGVNMSLDEDVPGVRAFPRSTSFVSCRVIIGPMEDSLRGTWLLCGRHTIGQITHERCQPATISWINNNPSATWDVTSNSVSNQPIHFGMTLMPQIRSRVAVQTCHIITPNGEDLAVLADSDYPGLSRVIIRDNTVCRIDIGPVNGDFVGNWTLYGTYASNFGFTLLNQPLNVFIYDEENPYNQAYNVTNSNPVDVFVNMGNIMTVNITAKGVSNACEVVTNTGQRYNNITAASLPDITLTTTTSSSRSICIVHVGPITQDLLGEWRLIGKYTRNNLFNEIRLPFNIIEDDPRNPIVDNSREVENLSPQNFFTTFGAAHSVSIALNRNGFTQSCHIRTPDNLQYILMAGFNLPGIEIIQGSGMSCGVRVLVESAATIGEWMLISRQNVRGHLIERRLAFTIYVEDNVPALPEATVIGEGSDLYVRLQNPTDLFQTCSLHGPVRNNADIDENFVRSCGYIVRNVTIADSGVWQIIYGNATTYRATIRVNVNPRFALEDKDLLWTRDAPINKTIGPEDAVYCRIENPSGRTTFEGFGRCNLALDRVTKDHVGVWRMTVATSGRVLTDTHEFVVKVTESVPKAEVTTSVETNKPVVALSCQVPSDVELTSCKFRDPSGRILLVSQGIGEDRYSFHNVGASLESNASAHHCGLRITNPVVEDLGLWRCAIETEEDIYYGFLTVLCPWAMLDPQVAAAVVSEPTLTADTAALSALEGDSVTMHCSVQSAVRYCYFRARNGTIYNVSPGSSEGFEYAGAGLDAGECSIRFPGLSETDSGLWSCHVGFNDHHEPEQRATINLTVNALMVAQQYHLEDADNTLVVSASVFGQRSLDYCRFVRIDGLGFTSEEVPTGYEDHSVVEGGRCEIRIPNPTILEMHPWTVVVRILGQDDEVARSTDHTLQMPGGQDDHEKPDHTEAPGHSDHPDHTDHPDHSDQPDHSDHTDHTERPDVMPTFRNSHFIIVWTSVLLISLALFFIGLMLGSRRNREWAYRRTSAVRDSFRRTFLKVPLPDVQHNNNNSNTAVAA